MTFIRCALVKRALWRAAWCRLAGVGGLGWVLFMLIACSRLAGLPPIPGDLSAEQAGLADLERWEDVAAHLRTPVSGEEEADSLRRPPKAPIDRARWALHLWNQRKEPEKALMQLREAVQAEPANLVLGNRYRMLACEIKRHFLERAKDQGEATPTLPDLLKEEPLAFLERLGKKSRAREVRLQIALAYLDRIALNPAPEGKASAEIESVRILSSILEEDGPYYLPALVARGLIQLHRPRPPARPGLPALPADAARRDLALAAAVGTKVGEAPSRLQGQILLRLGDACARESEAKPARNWWEAARDLSSEAGLLGEIEIRMSWPDSELADRMEQHLAELRADPDHPVSDLSFLWAVGGE